jgi:hypothetical protein
VGAGGSQEATFDLQESVKAGTYHFTLDSIIIDPVDVQFDLVWRSGGTDTTLTSFTAHYDPLPGAVYDAQPFEYDQDCPAIAVKSGDQLVFRYTASASSQLSSYEPDGDGPFANGRIPRIDLPR